MLLPFGLSYCFLPCLPTVVCFVGKKCDHHLGKIIYVDNKHMNITVEGCATPHLTLGFYTPMRAGFLMKVNFQ